MGLRYAAFVALYAVWVIGYTFQTSCTRSGQTVLTNDPKQRPLFTIFNTVGSLLGMGAMQFFAPILAKNYEGGYASAGFFRTLAPVGIVISILLTILAIIGIWEKPTSPSTSASAARPAKRSSCTSTFRSSRTTTPCSA